MPDIQINVTHTAQADTALDLPALATRGAAGADIRANLPARDQVTLAAGARALVPTGLCFEIPDGFEVQVRPRSGLALKHGVTVLNSPGTIDSDYRGEVGVILLNTGQDPFTVHHGDRIAQLVVAPVTSANYVKVTQLYGTHRGTAGFGSTGLD